jgi:hypothetical protein
MFANKDKVIQRITDFISDYINSCNKNNLLIIGNETLEDWFTIRLAELSRRNSGSEVYYVQTVSNNIRFEFAKAIILPEENFRDEVILFCENNSCLILSQLTRNRAKIYRDYHKHLHLGDIYPLLDIYYSEIEYLSSIINKNNSNIILNNSILNTPEYEFCYMEDEKNSIISSNELPTKNKNWFKYTKNQKELIASLHQREKLTRHKDLYSKNLPYPIVRDIE